ncbi:MAG: hypothetical protein K5659_09345 [Lachnospiraceae bacterium]|nr:hypothetical protein [Lachnospiraceae bacterium]
MSTGYIQRLISGEDAITSATTVIDTPSGSYVAIINLERHTNTHNLEIWRTFFKGEEIDFLFEDISVLIPKGDPNGLDILLSLQSRLPENQMVIRKEDVTLVLSKMENHKFDIIFVSKEMYDTMNFEHLLDDSMTVVIKENL